jgi:hypothetical protein
VQENAQKDVFGVKTKAKFLHPSKESLVKQKKKYVKIPKRDVIYIPAAYEMGSTVTSSAPRTISLSVGTKSLANLNLSATKS